MLRKFTATPLASDSETSIGQARDSADVPEPEPLLIGSKLRTYRHADWRESLRTDHPAIQSVPTPDLMISTSCCRLPASLAGSIDERPADFQHPPSDGSRREDVIPVPVATNEDIQRAWEDTRGRVSNRACLARTPTPDLRTKVTSRTTHHKPTTNSNATDRLQRTTWSVGGTGRIRWRGDAVHDINTAWFGKAVGP